MTHDETRKGVLFALGAAALNGTIGALSKLLIALNMDPAWIAFLKTLLGFVMVSAVLIFMKDGVQGRAQRSVIALAAFLGIFTLFFFETYAYRDMSAANVVVVLMATGAATASLAGWVMLGDRPGRNQWLGLVLTVVGISVILGINSEISVRGVLFAMCAGAGYGLFTVLLKKFRVQGGLALTRQLLCWGTIFLCLPAMYRPVDFALLTSWDVVLVLSGLAILPSILGFFCTTKAVTYLQPAKVQLLELSEPLFAAAIAFLMLGESVTGTTVVGAAFAVSGIYIGAIKTANVVSLPGAKI